MTETSKTKIKKSIKNTSSNVGIMWIVISISIIFILLLIILYLMRKDYNAHNATAEKQLDIVKKVEYVDKNKPKEDLIIDIKNNENDKYIEDTQNEVKTDTQKEDLIIDNTSIVISSNELKWQDEFIKTEFNDVYDVYYFAEIIGGEFKNGKLYSIIDKGYLGLRNVIYIYIELDNKIYFLPKKSNFDKSTLELFFTKDKTFFTKTNISIPQLKYNDELSFIHKEVKASLIKYSDPFYDNLDKFDEKYLRKIDYIHPIYGQAWTTDKSKESPESGILGLDGIYFKGPANTVITYRLIPSIISTKLNREDAYVGEKLDLILEDGSINSGNYVYVNSGCGIRSFIAGTDSSYYDNVNKSDLIEIGKTITGKLAYKINSVHHPIIKQAYKNYQEIENVEWMQNEIEKKVGKRKIESIEEFYNINPVIVFYDVFNRKHLLFSNISVAPAECGKPVIYLYPEKIMDVNVEVSPTNGFTKVEPTYPDGGWNVKAYPNGRILNYGNNKMYPYLFWEGVSDTWYFQPKEGFVVNRDELSQLFDKTLSVQNLNKQEIFDFKEFWIPKMLKNDNPYFFVTYTTKDFINRAAPLKVTPKPDTIIRVMMDYKPLDTKIKVKEMKFYPKERKGFTVIEWGGMLKK